MSNPSSGLRFDVYERVHLADDVAAIDELEEIELVPRIQIVQQGEQVMLKGHLLLTGVYRGQGEERSEQMLEHWIPVEITLPMNRINRLDDISVEIDNFDVDLLSARTINVTGVLSLLGIEVEQQQEPEEWQREEPFTVIHKREPEEERQAEPGWAISRPQQEAREASAGFEGWVAPETQGFREALQREAAQREAAERERLARQQEAAEGEARALEAARREAGEREAAARAAADREAQARETARRQQEAAEREATARVEAIVRAEEEREAARAAAELEAAARLEAQREAAVRSAAEQEEEREAWREALARIEAEREAAPYEPSAFDSFAREEESPPSAGADRADELPSAFQDQQADDPEDAESFGWQSDSSIGAAGAANPFETPEDFSHAEAGRQEMKIALGSKPSEDPSEKTAANVNFRSLLQSSRREQEAKAAAEQSAQKAAQAQADKAAEDEIEWKNLFFGRSSEEQSFKKVRLCIVQREETLDSIAGRYQLQAREIALYNRLSDQSVSEGQVLYIP